MRVFVAGAGRRRRKTARTDAGRSRPPGDGTTSRPESAEAIRRLGAEPVVVDGLDAVGIGQAVARAEPDAIIHEMTALSGTPDFRHFDRWFALTNRLRTEGTEHLLAAARRPASSASSPRASPAGATAARARGSRPRTTRWIRTRSRIRPRRSRRSSSSSAPCSRRRSKGSSSATAASTARLVGGARRHPPQADVPSHRQRRGHRLIDAHRRRGEWDARRPRARPTRRLQHRRRRTGADPGVHPGDRRSARSAATRSASPPGSAGCSPARSRSR